jgi:hypothetical protein
MIGLLRQNLPVKLLGLAQPPGLVVLQCQIEGLLDRKLGHAANSQYPARITPSQQMVTSACHETGLWRSVVSFIVFIL